MINPYDVMQKVGVPGARVVTLPQNFAFELTMDTWWSAVQRARLFSDFTGLDALYSYGMKSSTLIRSAIDKRLRPLKSRTFGVYIKGVEDERLTDTLKNSPLMREIIYQRGLANFTYARVVGVNKDKSTFVYPLRNLDVKNKAVKEQTYNTKGDYVVKNHVNMFWVQTSYQSEDTLGLLEPVMRDYINIMNAQNAWQAASQYSAYKQMVLYVENGDPEMMAQAKLAAQNIGLGQVLVAGQATDIDTKQKIRDYELVNTLGGEAADTFRIFKENIEQLRNQIMQIILGSSLLGMSDKNTNSERLVRAHLKLFRDICESDAVEVQDWLNTEENRVKLAYVMGEPALAKAEFIVKPANYIDIGDIETYTKMLKELNIIPTESFIEKSGLDPEDVILPDENVEDAGTGDEGTVNVSKERNAARSFPAMVVERTGRLFKRR